MILYVIGAYFLLVLFLYRYFARGDRGEKEPRSALRTACVYGVLATFVAGPLNAGLLPVEVTSFLNSEGALPVPPLETLLIGGLMVGVIEESLKFIPLGLYLYKKPFFNETTDGVVYFALAGMWFGVVESVFYTLNYGADVGIMRIIVAPFLHAGFSALAGLGLIKFKLTKNPMYVFMGLGLAIIIHGIYDFFLFSQIPLLVMMSLVIAVAVNFGPFRYFKKARRTDEKLGLSGPKR